MKKSNFVYSIFTTLFKAKKWVEKEKWTTEGCICPCCNQTAKVYKRRLNSGMAMELIKLYKLSQINDSSYFHHTSFSSRVNGEISRFVHWGMVEEMPKSEDQPDKKTSGYWRITELGRKFVENKIRVPAYIYLFNAELLLSSENDESISIIEALDRKFSYVALMGEFIDRPDEYEQ